MGYNSNSHINSIEAVNDFFSFIVKENPKFTFIDLFAGIGGFRIAM